jgi:hypothetical protein
MSARFISAPEAVHRIFEFKMYDMSHSIIRLPVHLPLNQNLYFQTGNEEQALQLARQGDSKLEAWFKLNQTDHNTHTIHYPDILYHYVYSDKNQKWEPCKQGAHRIISRLCTVSPKDIEIYSLRLLLLHIPGA